VLVYDEGKVEVYLNGVQLVKDLDFTANNDTTVTLLGTGADSSDTLTVTSLAKASFLEGEIDSAQAALTSTATNQVVDTMSTVNHRTAKYIVQMTQNSRYHSQEVLLVHDGTTVHMTTYAEIYTESDLGSVDADISGGNVRLLVSPNYANTDIRTKRIDLGV
jgi:ABC-type branched-subunit amino acid transport system ATPase component